MGCFEDLRTSLGPISHHDTFYQLYEYLREEYERDRDFRPDLDDIVDHIEPIDGIDEAFERLFFFVMRDHLTFTPLFNISTDRMQPPNTVVQLDGSPFWRVP